MSTVISVDEISKLYRLGEIGTGSLAHDVNRWWHKVRGYEDPYLKVGQSNDRATTADSDYVYAVKDVSFDVNEGEVLGIIGRNGAGKSTLLKLLSRVTTPTSGQIKVKGRIASLLEVGTGFHPELTGRENIYLNGAILGMRKFEIRRKFDEIVDFSGCERYIDTPVKRYSSGMYVRLAFAVAAHLESEILILDEVLAVGDSEFQKKCLGKMKEVAGLGRTVLFVSHNMAAVSSLCTSAISLINGTAIREKSVQASIQNYLNGVHVGGLAWERTLERKIIAAVTFEKVSIELSGSQPNLTLNVRCQVKSHKKHKSAFVAIDIVDSNSVTLMQAIPTLECLINYHDTSQEFEVGIDLPPLVPGDYSVTMWMGPHNDETFDEAISVVSFTIVDSPTSGRSFPHTREHGSIVPPSILRFP